MSHRLTIALIGLMLIPLLLVGYIMLATTEILSPPATFWKIFSDHVNTCLLIIGVMAACVLVAFMFARQITKQIELLVNTVKILNSGKEVHQINLKQFYQELWPLVQELQSHAEFHDNMGAILEGIFHDAVEKTIPARSEDDTIVNAVNQLISHLQNAQQVINAITEGNLTLQQTLDSTGDGLQSCLQKMLTELTDLISKARHYTNQIVRAGSQMNSITTQELQDNQVATKCINEIAQAVDKMATHIRNVAEHLRGQSSLLNETSASIENTVHSVEEIASQITYLKGLVEKSTPSTSISEKTVASLDLIYNATKAIEHDANTCVALSEEAAEEAEQGKIVVHQTIGGISRIQEAMDEFFAVVRQLGEHAEEVGETLEVISDVADHTNLLAINAAIISAHAGEHGRDFAVIADEIGKFAERTRESTEEIEELLRTIRSEFSAVMRAMGKASKAVATGVALSHQAGTTLGKIASSIFRTKEMVTRIAVATTDQSRENSHIRTIMEDLVQSQTENQEQMNTVLQQLIQTTSQIRGISSEQVEGSARIAALTQDLNQVTRTIGEATIYHVTTANQIVDAVNYIRKLIQRTTRGVEKTAQLNEELFTIGGNLAFTMGHFILEPKIPQPQIVSGIPIVGFIRRGAETFFDAMAAGIRKESEQAGFQVLEMNSQYEATTQVEEFNWLLRQPNLRGIILCPIDKNVAHKLVQKSIGCDIACVSADESIAATVSVRSGNREGGRRAAEIFMGHLQPNTLVGVLVDHSVESMIRRALGFHQRAKEYPLEIVEIYCDMTNLEQIKNYIAAGIEEHPEMKGLFLTNETVATAYLQALHEGILPSEDLLAVGYDDTPLAQAAIRNDELLGAIFQDPQEIGRQAFQYLSKLISKEMRVEEFEHQTIYIPTVQVTKETLRKQDLQNEPPTE